MCLQLNSLVLQEAFLIPAHELQLQRKNFLSNFLHLEDRLEYFQLKSWCLLKNQTLPMPFGLPIIRSHVKPQPKRDIITMLVSVYQILCLIKCFSTVFLSFPATCPPLCCVKENCLWSF